MAQEPQSVEVIELPPEEQAVNANVEIVDGGFPETKDIDVSIVTEDGKKVTSPETSAQQNIQGATQQAKVQPGQTPPQQKKQEQVIAPPSQPKTDIEDVKINFEKYMGRKPETEDDLKNVEFLTTLSPQEVERRLKESGRQAQLDTIKTDEDEAKAEEDKRTEEQAKKDAEAKAGFEAMDRAAAERKIEEDKKTEDSYLDLITDIRSSNSEELATMKSNLEIAKTTLDEANQAIIDSIEETFDRRISQQEQVNKALLAGERVRGFTSGRARFANTLQANIISAEESAGISRIADIEAQKTKALAEAKLAVASDDYDRLNEEIKNFEAAQDKQVAELIALNQLANENERLALSKMAEARQATLLGLTVEEAQRKETVFLAEQEDRIARNTASTLISIDDEGNISTPTDEEILLISEREGISPAILVSEINSRIGEIENMQAEKRKDYLNEIKTLADIDRTQFLTEKDKALLPLTMAEKQISIDNKILAGLKTQYSISWQDGSGNEKELTAKDFGISQVEVMGDLQSSVNLLNEGSVDFNSFVNNYPEFLGFVSKEVDEYDPSKVKYKISKPTSAQLDIIVERRAENIKSQMELENSLTQELLNDPSIENQESLKGTLVNELGYSSVDANRLIAQIGVKSNIDLKLSEQFEKRGESALDSFSNLGSMDMGFNNNNTGDSTPSMLF